ncbi:hypothetical protein CCR75_006947 [Bremia lactucae]|uniref:PH domain-containing protein n=1 Tax=Bremia lactucae TaxID=4779 RepID=A0A976FQF3_BRELC|nr:hypothetical protein CCR75_006947 [Bremia lactucae]
MANAACCSSLEARECMAQLQLKTATKHVIAAGRVGRSSYCDHSGWGLKQGSIIKSWKRRYFVLKGRELMYFEERSPSGKGIDEKGRLRISGVEFTSEFSNTLLVRGELKNQAVKIQVDSNDECKLWYDKMMNALEAALSDVMSHNNLKGDARSRVVAMKGWLLKEGQNFKTWKRRYMTLTGRLIQYRMQPSEKPLGETRVNAVNINLSRPFALDIYSDNNRILRIAADSFRDIEAWDQAFAKATGKRPCFKDPYAGQDAPFLGETFEESVQCEGWLYKRGQRSREWQRRYFKLMGFKLLYQDGPGESVPKGAGTVVGLELGEEGSNSIFVELSSSRVLCVSADSQALIEQWIEAICTLLMKDSKSLERNQAVAMFNANKGSNSSNLLTRAFSRALSNALLPPLITTNVSQSSGFTSIDDQSRVSGGNLNGSKDSMVTIESSLSSLDNTRLSSIPRESISGLRRKSGWLHKEGACVRSLKRRYFMADGPKLYYFEQIGELPRGHGIVTSAFLSDAYPNCLELILTTKRTLRVVAESLDEIRSWLEHFEASVSGKETTFDDHRSANNRFSLGTDEFASNETEMDSGWLLKKGQNFRTWKRRYFKLDGKQFSYSSAPDAPPLGRGVVEQVTIGNARPFCLDVCFQNGRIMQLVASNEKDLMAWNRRLQAAVLSESIESDFKQETQFDFDDADEDAQLNTMRTVVTAASAFKRGFSKTTSTDSTVSNSDSMTLRDWQLDCMIESTENVNALLNERAEAAGIAVAAAVERAEVQKSTRLETEEPVVCSGWLRKEGGTVKNWKRRYFTLHGPILCYFKSDNGALLRSFTVCHVVTLRSKRLCLEITTEEGRKLLVASETQVDLDRWLDHLHRAIAAEKRIKVSMEKQAEEASFCTSPRALPNEKKECGCRTYKVL